MARTGGPSACAVLVAIAAAACVSVAPAWCGEPETLAAEGLVVAFHPGDRARAAQVPRVVAEARRSLAAELGLELPSSVLVRIVRGAGAFSRTIDGEPVELFAGLAYPDSGTILVSAEALDRSGSQPALTRTLRHELAHLALGHTVGAQRRPTWFDEGLACAFGSPMPRTEMDRVAGGVGFALRALSRFPERAAAMSLAYAQSESVVRFVARRSPAGTLRSLLASLRAGAAFDEALRATTGFDVDELDAAWRAQSRPGPFERALQAVFGPSRILLWAALALVVAYVVVRARRRRAAEHLDDIP